MTEINEDDNVILMFKLDEGKDFKRVISALASTLTRSRFGFDKSGMFIRATNDSHIAFVNCEIPAIAFDDYKCIMQEGEVENEEGEVVTEEVPIELDMDIDDLDKVLDRCGDDDSITIVHRKVKIDAEDGEEVWRQSERIEIKIEGDRTRTFQLNQKEVPEMYVPKGDITSIIPLYTWNVEIDPSFFEAIIKDAVSISDTISIQIDNGEDMTFSAWSKIGNYEEPTQDIPISLVDGKEEIYFEGDYQISVLKEMISMAKESPDLLLLQMGMKEEEALPMRAEMEVLGEGIVNYFLAPKAEV
jgi:hypothetical protein